MTNPLSSDSAEPQPIPPAESVAPSAISQTTPTELPITNYRSLTVVIETILLIAIIAAGAYLRFVGLDWDTNQHLHPDERFLTMVSSSISSVKSVGDYFDTKK
ncbi:MAG: hypothetical protein HZB52_00055, partial [Chloroflexi bacterium]|nr:hypothetical protein [Chloroflexota bacterium]